MREPLYAGIDMGTTFFKVGLYDQLGRLKGQGRCAFRKDRDSTGRCTVPARRFRETVSVAWRDALARAGSAPDAVQGISYCAQANTFILLDRQSSPLTPLIVWPDLRAAPLCDFVSRQTSSESFLKSSGQGLMGAEWMLPKLDWIRRNEPDLWSRTARILTISDYLVFLLTGAFAGDSGTAALTGLVDTKMNSWNENVTGFLKIDQKMLPELHRPASFTLPVGKNGSDWLGVGEGTPFTVGALDHHAAAIGGGIGSDAPVSVSFGTSLVCFGFEDTYHPVAGACIGPATEPGRYYKITFNAPGASAMDWYREHFAPGASIEGLIEQAVHVEPGCEGMRAEIRDGGIVFLNRKPSHGQGHHVRAIMELIGRNTRNLLRDFAGDNGNKLPPVIAVGGAARSEIWMRIVEAAAGVNVFPATPADTASRGAAMFAAVADGLHNDLSACARHWLDTKERSVYEHEHTRAV